MILRPWSSIIAVTFAAVAPALGCSQDEASEGESGGNDTSTTKGDGGAACDLPTDLGADAGEPTPEGATSFLPFAQHFVGYHRWRSMPGQTKYPAPDFHLPGPTTVFINRPPPPGSSEFPVGTVIVKETSGGSLKSRTVFAMVKRGGGYNESGAVGWEWFELKSQCGKDEPVIQWRGLGPPSGEGYGGDKTGCNNCHALAADNDFVMTAGLSLSGFAAATSR